MGGKRTATKTTTEEAVASTDIMPAATAVVHLPADCRMAAQAALKAQLLDVLCKSEIVLDVSALERVDTAALQLLVLFRRELECSGGTFRWSGANQVLAEAAGVLGLERLLNLPAATLA
ncbi:phospholipid transport system transporter-binding protein [Rhodanobacter sp. TND4EL1]